MEAILFDLDGVFYEGEQPVSGAAEVMTWIAQQQLPYLFLTNTTSRSRQAIVDKLAAMQITTDVDHILTPPVAARVLLQQYADNPVALFVPESVASEFNEVERWQPGSPVDPAAIVLGDLGQDWHYQNLNQILRLLMLSPQPQLIALGMTRYWKAGDGFRLDVGAFVKALEYATAVEPIVMGKPSASFYQAALDMLNVSARSTVMIGDDIRSDVGGAQAVGINGILVRTGKYLPEDLDSGIMPDVILDSVADFPAWLKHRV